jgi:hypothetical protein
VWPSRREEWVLPSFTGGRRSYAGSRERLGSPTASPARGDPGARSRLSTGAAGNPDRNPLAFPLMSSDFEAESGALDAYSAIVTSAAAQLTPRVAALRIRSRRGESAFEGLELNRHGDDGRVADTGFSWTRSRSFNSSA